MFSLSDLCLLSRLMLRAAVERSDAPDMLSGRIRPDVHYPVTGQVLLICVPMIRIPVQGWYRLADIIVGG